MAFDFGIRNESTRHHMQLGFQRTIGTDIALAQLQSAVSSGQKFMAVLDLKSAYDRVNREVLFRRCAQILCEKIARM